MVLKETLPAVYTRCAEPSDSIVYDERRELTVYTWMRPPTIVKAGIGWTGSAVS